MLFRSRRLQYSGGIFNRFQCGKGDQFSFITIPLRIKAEMSEKTNGKNLPATNPDELFFNKAVIETAIVTKGIVNNKISVILGTLPVK